MISYCGIGSQFGQIPVPLAPSVREGDAAHGIGYLAQVPGAPRPGEIHRIGKECRE